MKRSGWIFALAVMALACDDSTSKNYANKSDDDFMEIVARANYNESQLGELAAMQGGTPQVKAFGQQMKTEHDEAQSELKGIADNYIGVNWPDALDEEHLQLKLDLGKLTGYQFDTMYVNSQVRDHIAALAIFQAELDSGKEQRVKDFAAKYKPHIQKHLDRADSIKTMLAEQQHAREKN